MTYENSLPALDRYEDQPGISRDVERILDRQGYQQFLEDMGDSYVNSEGNATAITNWLNEREVPCSRRNCAIAYQSLLNDGALETPVEDEPSTSAVESPDRGIKALASTDTVRLRYATTNAAERQLLSERPERLQEIVGDKLAARQAEDAANRALAGKPGQKISEEFKAKFYASLAANKNAQGTRRGEARALVATWVEDQGLDIPVNSQEFNRLVSEVIKQSQI